MAKSLTAFDYPLIIKQQLGMITVSCPDLGIVVADSLSLGGKIDRVLLLKLAKAIGQVWIKANSEITRKDKTKLRKPSQTKEILSPKYNSKPLTAPEACKLLGVSVNTLRRMSDRGDIETSYTARGHRRYTEGSIEKYLSLHHD